MVIILFLKLLKKASLAIVNRLTKNLSSIKTNKSKNSLNFLTNCSKIFRKNLKTKIIAITGSCGKTTLKEMLGSTLKKFQKRLILRNLIIINMEYL